MQNIKDKNIVTPLAASIFKEVCQRCKTVLDSKMCDAYLYGSYARGDYNLTLVSSSKNGVNKKRLH